MRSATFSFSLLADAVFALNDEGFLRLKLQVKAEPRRYSVQRLVLAVPLRSPVSIPDTTFIEARSGHSGPAPVQAFFIQELISAYIRQSRMCQIEVIDRPGR